MLITKLLKEFISLMLKKPGKKIKLAARVIVTAENNKDVIVVCARPYGQRAVIKYA